MSKPLEGVSIVEMAGIGPAPFCGMMLADHGAEVIRIIRAGATDNPKDPLLRGRTTIEADLKTETGVAKVRDLACKADGLIEGFRPGVMERLGLGPDDLCSTNPRLVFGRMTGWGQSGPLSQTAGHDIDYIAISGALSAFGRVGERPTPPINMVGDFGGGGMLLAFGMLAGILDARTTGIGSVVDCSMTEGSALLMSMIWGMRAYGGWKDERGVNLLDTGAHFYDTYETSDGKYIALGAIEPQFYAEFRQRVGLEGDPDFDAQMHRAQWPNLKSKLDALFLSRTRAEWCELLEGTDACFAPVLSMSEAPRHPQNIARNSFVTVNDVVQPAPAPKFERHSR